MVGVLETKISYQEKDTKFASIFYEQIVEAFIDAIKLFITLLMDNDFIKLNASKFGEN